MQAKVICRTTAKDTQTFYVSVNGKEHYLFKQKYRRSVKKHFQNGITINQTKDYSSVTSRAVKRTLDKLPPYIHFLEKDCEVAVYEKTKQKKETKRNRAYKREPFRWQDYAWEVA